MKNFEVNNVFNDGLLELDRIKICKVLERFSGLESAVLYGSRAMGNFKSNSDIDLAVLGDVSDRELAALTGDLEELSMPYKFDVIALNQVKLEPLRKHVVDHGRVFWKS